MQSEPLLPHHAEVRRSQLRTRLLVAGCAIIAVAGISCGIVFGILQHKAPLDLQGSQDRQDRQGQGRHGYLSTNVTTNPLMLGARAGARASESACYAPPGIWGPACSSDTSLVSSYANQWIWYHIKADDDTAVFCKVVAAACPSGMGRLV
jgi:hypothetical protein